MSIDGVNFLHPVKVRDIIEIYGELGEIKRHSMTVHISAVNMRSKEIAASTNIVFVFVDKKGEKMLLSDIMPKD